MGSFFSPAASSIASTPSLGVNTALTTGAMPTSVMPLSQQLAGLAMPTLQTPVLGGTQRLPSLGVDTSVTPSGPSFFSQLGKGLEGIGDSYKTVSKNLQQPEKMQFMQLQPMQRPTTPLQQVDLLAMLRNLGSM